MDSSTKTCKDCGNTKHLMEFRPEKRNKDGRAGRCAVCASAKSAAYYQANRDRVLAAVKEHAAKNSEAIKAYKKQWQADNADKLREKRRADYLSNPERFKARASAWYWENHARAIEYRRAHRAANSNAYRAARQLRRAREKAAPGKFTPADIERLLRVQRGRCACCRKFFGKGGYHIDHVQPLVSGGTNHPINLQLLCPFCNRSKGKRDQLGFMASNGFLL